MRQGIRRPQLVLKELGTMSQLTRCQLCTGRSELLDSVLCIKSLGWHMQWTPLPAEPSTHPSHFRNDPCKDLGLAQQKARGKLEEKKKQIHSFGVHLGQPRIYPRAGSLSRSAGLAAGFGDPAPVAGVRWLGGPEVGSAWEIWGPTDPCVWKD